MFKNILIAEDHESINISVRKTLDDLGIHHKTFRAYCDEAYQVIVNGLRQENFFDLLITDLSFDDDIKKQAINGGRELIARIRALQPNIKVIVFSLESKINVVDSLFDDLDIDGYVRKARYDAEDLKRAIQSVSQNKKYRSADLMHSRGLAHTYDFKNIDIEIITLLSDGRSQKELPALLKSKQLKPAGLSSIEKRLNQIKAVLDISNNGQLIAYCKDKKII